MTMQEKMNSWQRTMTALSHQEADRVPVFLTLTLHGAKELGLSIQEYFTKPANVVEGQLRLQKKFGHDCFYSFYYAAAELIAWGGEAIFYDDGMIVCIVFIMLQPSSSLGEEKRFFTTMARLTLDRQSLKILPKYVAQQHRE